MRTIRITGTGQLKLRPDVTVITMNLRGKCPDYDKTLEKSASDTELLKNALEQFGFERRDLKTTDFNVSADYERYEKNGTYHTRFAGYEYEHALKLEFDSDNERLGKILTALSGCGANPELEISYTVKDREAAKNELLGNAVANAMAKAEVLTRAAGVRLKEIQSVDYSWGEINFNVKPMRKAINTALRACTPDFEPDDLQLSDTATVVREIE